MKKISDLEQKRWWRTLKVIYFGILLLIFIFVFINNVIDYGEIGTMFLTLGIMAVITLLLQRVMYYILLGNFMPKK